MTGRNNDRANRTKVLIVTVASFFATLATLMFFSTSLASTIHPTAATTPDVSLTSDDIPWPPFWFELIPTYEDGKIIYQLGVYSRVDQQMFDMVIQVPIPEGTRFLEANAQPETQTEFDGQTVTFVTVTLDKYIEETSFAVEITDPARTVFSTQPWVSWKGPLQGDYLFEPVSIDITQQPLNWQSPGLSRLQLGVEATVSDGSLTYAIYPKAIGQERMWDVNLEVSLPEGVTFIKADAPPPFEIGFKDQVISFSTLELERQKEIEPLTFQVEIDPVPESALVIPIHAAWKNGAADPIPGTTKEIGKRYEGPEFELSTAPAAEQFTIETEVRQPNLPQQIVFDSQEDVPFTNYDLTGIAFFDNGPNLIIRFNTAQEVGPVKQPLDFTLYIDSDCNSATGQPLQNRGVDYRVSYNHKAGYSYLAHWEAAQLDWAWSQLTDLVGFATGKTVTISIPRHLLGTGQQFCWVGQSSNQTDAFYPAPPRDWIPNDQFVHLTQYQSGPTATKLDLEQELAFPPVTEAEDVDEFMVDDILPEPVVTLTTTIALQGKLAIPLADGYGFSDVHIISLADGRQLDQIANASQPNFRFDGQKLLTNHIGDNEGNVYRYDLGNGRTNIVVLNHYDPNQNIYEYDLINGTDTQVSDQAQDTYPFYNPAGNRLVYAGSEPAIALTELPSSHLFVQCSLLPPHQESSQRCQNLSELGMLVHSAQQESEIGGSHPVWTSNDMIVYNGCGNGGKPTTCGIYAIDSSATKGGGKGAVPTQLTQAKSDLPADSKGNLIAFTSQRDGNWEAYIMDLDGNNVRNLSNSPDSNDGLPTISPDGQWVAFVSDRGGQWAIWLAPAEGGLPQKMFDLPSETPWINADRVWLDERISWGP